MKTQLAWPVLFLLPGILCAQEFKKLDVLNSDSRETNLGVTPNGRYLFFMSQRGGQPWSVLRDEDSEHGGPRHDGDIWYSTFENNEWQPPVCMGPQINTADGEDEPNISADGQAVYFQSWRDDWPYTGGPYYKAELDGVLWKNPVGLGDEITRFFLELSERSDRVLVADLKANQLYEEYLTLQKNRVKDRKKALGEKGMDMDQYILGTDGMAISPDENTFIVSAFTPEDKKYDLYISRKNKDGLWSYPKLLNINTKDSEISVFIASDNKTVYFASDRKGGLGGYDIYKTTLLEGVNCTPAINIGPPYNTPKDEYNFVVNSTQEVAYLVFEGDIMQVNLNEQAKPDQAIIVNGMVIDEENNPVEASLRLVEGARQDTLLGARSNQHSGAYSFSFARQEGRYVQVVTTHDGMVVEEPFEITPSTGNVLNFTIVIKRPRKNSADIVQELSKKDLREGEIFRIDKLYFEADEFSIKPESFPVLDQIAGLLAQRPDIIFEIGGHTNGIPSHEYSDQLSEKRAHQVFDYLTKKGLTAEKLKYRGYGKRYPIAGNDTLQGRMINQRVEIKILKVKQ